MSEPPEALDALASSAAVTDETAVHPAGAAGVRSSTPEEIAAAALYLASDDSAMVTGTMFAIDGGMG